MPGNRRRSSASPLGSGGGIGDFYRVIGRGLETGPQERAVKIVTKETGLRYLLISPRLSRFAAALALCALASACAEVQFLTHAAKEVANEPANAPGRTGAAAENGAGYKVGKPYRINGNWYYPRVDYKYVEEGIASWYGPNFHGKPTANGAVFDMNKVSAAHRTLPLPSIVRITNLENGRSLKVKVNDRGPYAKDRIIDVSRRTAQLLGFEKKGTALVRVEIVEDDSRQLAAYMQGGEQLADASSSDGGAGAPPLPTAAPTVSVSGSELPPPPGSSAAPPPSEAFQVTPVASNTLPSVRPNSLPDSDAALTQQVVVGSPTVFVQAGAFSQFVNAQRAQILLSQVGEVHVEQVLTSTVPLFRIRVGPAETVDAADSLLKQVIAAGYPDAKIVAAN